MVLDNYNEGDVIKDFFICIDKIKKITKYGDMYLDISLRNKDGVVKGKVWENADYFSEKFEVGCAVAIKGRIVKYKNIKELNIAYINEVKNDMYGDYGYKEKLLVPEVSVSVNKLYDFIINSIASLDNPYKKLLFKIYKNNSECIKSIPSMKSSYNLKGGYVQKTSNILILYNKIESKGPFDRNMLISLILIKEIGYIDYYNDDLYFSISDRGQKFEVQQLSYDIILNNINTYDKFPLSVKDFFQSVLIGGKMHFEYVEYVNHLYALDELIHVHSK